MSIRPNPTPLAKLADIAEFGTWHYIIRRQIGPHLVTWQWIRIKHESGEQNGFANGKWRDTYRDPNQCNQVFHIEDGEYGSGW